MWIPYELHPFTKLFVPEDEFEDYVRCAKNCQFPDVEIIPCKSPNLALKRVEIAEWARDRGWKKFAMIDDDISQFSTRIYPGDTPLRRSAPSDIIEMFVYVERYLDWYVNVGISQRLFNSNFIGDDPIVIENTRMVRFLAYNVDMFLSCTHGRNITSEDMDINLQLLLRGYKNCVLHKWTQDQSATGTPGGCAAYRTIEMHNADKILLNKMYPGVTTLQEKRNISDAAIKAGMANRLEVVVDWEKAYQWGVVHGDNDRSVFK